MPWAALGLLQPMAGGWWRFPEFGNGGKQLGRSSDRVWSAQLGLSQLEAGWTHGIRAWLTLLEGGGGRSSELS